MSRLLSLQAEPNNSGFARSSIASQYENPPMLRLRPRPVSQMKLPSLHEMIALYSNASDRAAMPALELPKLRRIPHFGVPPMNQWLEPQEPFKLVVRVPDEPLRHVWPVAKPIPLEVKEIRCSVCKKRFSSKARLRIHSVTHSCKKPFKCELCNEHFAQRCGLTYHTRRVHTGERPYSCSLCSRTFIQKTDLNKHRRVHERHETPVECTICHRKVPQSALARHTATH